MLYFKGITLIDVLRNTQVEEEEGKLRIEAKRPIKRLLCQSRQDTMVTQTWGLAVEIWRSGQILDFF